MKFKNWKNFKKNEIVIYAIALMLVTAGYFNYTTNLENDAIETSIENIVVDTIEQGDIGDARLVSNNDLSDGSLVSNNELEKEEKDNVEQNEENNSEKNTVDTGVEVKNENDSLANAEADENKTEDYFINSKIERDTSFASMISTYEKILEDNTISETQKAIAMKEITKINDTKNIIYVCENILLGKGFSNLVILVNNNSVNVVVQKSEKLTSAEVAQIQNVVSREFKVELEDIHIMEKE